MYAIYSGPMALWAKNFITVVLQPSLNSAVKKLLLFLFKPNIDKRITAKKCQLNQLIQLGIEHIVRFPPNALALSSSDKEYVC